MDIPGLEQVRKFVEAATMQNLGSTGATVVNYTNVLYNVDGSTDDPYVPPYKSWTKVFIGVTGIENAECYVTNDPDGRGRSHPVFSKGGHMTINQDGSVESGGKCYLMPLCSGHNNKSRDGIAFEHTNTKMVRLTGYMKGELAATFLLRLPNEHPYALLYYSEAEQAWEFQDYDEAQRDEWQRGLVGQQTPGLAVAVHRVDFPEGELDRVDAPEGKVHKVIWARLPGVA